MKTLDGINRFLQRGRASWLYRRGVKKAKKRNHQGAIADYTSTIDLRVMSPDELAMVLYHRAIGFFAIGDHPRGTEDLETVLAMDKSILSANVKTMARQMLAATKPQASDRSTRASGPNANPGRDQC